MSIPESMKNIRGRGRPRLLKIPESFQVFGHTIKVVFVSRDELARMDVLENPDSTDIVSGMYSHETKTIYLCDELTGDNLEVTFMHEKTHCILEHAGRDDLSSDESLVDLLAEIDHQVSKSLKYNSKPYGPLGPVR